jgi:hypothetical protein
LRADRSTWLGSSTSEDAAVWLELSDAEHTELAEALPRLGDMLQPGALYFPDDPRLISGNGHE